MKSNKLELGKLIGRGGMGEVYEAYLIAEDQTRKTVAAKKIILNNKKEGNILSSLNHPNICSFFEIKEHEGDFYVLMELVNGPTLDYLIEENIKNNRLPESEDVENILKQLISATKYLHDGILIEGNKQAVLHRDLSPQNIMIDQSAMLKIIDFGIGKTTNSNFTSTETINLYGKLFYLAPDLLETNRHSRETDLYSIGVICFEYATSNRLFRGSNITESLKLIDQGIQIDLSSIRPDLSQFTISQVMRFLKKEPKDRKFITQPTARAENGSNSINIYSSIKLFLKKIGSLATETIGLCIFIFLILFFGYLTCYWPAKWAYYETKAHLGAFIAIFCGIIAGIPGIFLTTLVPMALVKESTEETKNKVDTISPQLPIKKDPDISTDLLLNSKVFIFVTTFFRIAAMFAIPLLMFCIVYAIIISTYFSEYALLPVPVVLGWATGIVLFGCFLRSCSACFTTPTRREIHMNSKFQWIKSVYVFFSYWLIFILLLLLTIKVVSGK